MSAPKMVPSARIPAMAAMAAAVLAWPATVAAGVSDDYMGALLGEQLRHELREASRSIAPARIPKRQESPATGPRSWNPGDQNPWANAYGTPAASYPPLSVRANAGLWRPVRLCACYLPVDARSWDGGPLTEADIGRLCRAQCY